MDITYRDGIARMKDPEIPPVNPSKLPAKVDTEVEAARVKYEEEHHKKIDIYTFVADTCNITPDAYKKMQNGSRRWTREQLGKLCIGLGFTTEQANELFQLQGGELNRTNLLDQIIFCALRDHDTVFDYCQEVKEHTGKDIESFK